MYKPPGTDPGSRVRICDNWMTALCSATLPVTLPLGMGTHFRCLRLHLCIVSRMKSASNDDWSMVYTARSIAYFALHTSSTSSYCTSVITFASLSSSASDSCVGAILLAFSSLMFSWGPTPRMSETFPSPPSLLSC